MCHIKHMHNTRCLVQDILWLFKAVQREKADSEADVNPVCYKCLAWMFICGALLKL